MEDTQKKEQSHGSSPLPCSSFYSNPRSPHVGPPVLTATLVQIPVTLRPARQDGRKIRCANALYFFPLADLLVRQTVVAHQNAAKACGAQLAD